jgi:hypothetical protein
VQDSVGLKRFYLVLFSLYVVSGLAGTAWISDEFDSQRIFVVAFIGIPLTVLFYMLNFYVRDWRFRTPVLYRLTIASLFFVYLWGNFLLLNAAGSEEKKEIFTLNTKVMALNINQKIGAFGVPYTQRW